MKPLATVEKESFKSLVIGLCPTATVMCRKTLQSRIIDTYDNTVSRLQTELNGAAYVCTTADIWSSHEFQAKCNLYYEFLFDAKLG